MTDGRTFKERQKDNRDPLQYALYKGARGKYGALRFNLKKAYADDRRDKYDGCIFLDAAPASGPDVYDWENNKIVMKLEIVDIAKIILFLRSPRHAAFLERDRDYQPILDEDGKHKYKNLIIYHDRGAGTHNRGKNITSLTVEKGDGMMNYMFYVKQAVNGTTKQAKIPVSPDECISLGTLLQAGIVHTLAWDATTPTEDPAVIKKLSELESKIAELASLVRQALK